MPCGRCCSPCCCGCPGCRCTCRPPSSCGQGRSARSSGSQRLPAVVQARWPHLTTRIAARGADPRAPLAGALAIAVLYVAAAAAVSPRIPTGDEPHYLVITQSLLRDGDLQIENNHRAATTSHYVDFELSPTTSARHRRADLFGPRAGRLGAGGAGVAIAGRPRRGHHVSSRWWRPRRRDVAQRVAPGRRRGAAWVAAAAVMLTVPWLFTPSRSSRTAPEPLSPSPSACGRSRGWRHAVLLGRCPADWDRGRAGIPPVAPHALRPPCRRARPRHRAAPGRQDGSRRGVSALPRRSHRLGAPPGSATSGSSTARHTRRRPTGGHAERAGHT